MNQNVFKQILFLLLVPAGIITSQVNYKSLTQTSVKDFSENNLVNLRITNQVDGEVQFTNQLIRTAEDQRDDSLLRDIIKDNNGNMYRTWITGKNVFYKKYSPDGKELTKAIQANDINGSCADGVKSCLAVMNNGTLLIAWIQSSLFSPSGNESIIRGQVFQNDSVKHGTNLSISNTPIIGGYTVTALANNNDNSFIVFYQVRLSNSEERIHFQKCDINGNRVGITTPLNKNTPIKSEFGSFVLGDDSGFWMAWGGTTTINGTDSEIYLRRFAYNGDPLTDMVKINDDTMKVNQGGLHLCYDNNKNILVTWLDSRNSIPGNDVWNYDGYGQLFNKAGLKIGDNIKIENTSYLDNREYQTVFNGKEFQISWLCWEEKTRQYITFTNKWVFKPVLSGSMVSKVIDLGPGGISLKEISWSNILPLNSSIKLKLRSGNTLGELENALWSGPDNSTEYYSISTGQNINAIHSEKRYLQYKTDFNAADGVSPVLHSVTIMFTSKDSIAPAVPKEISAIPGHSLVTINMKKNSEKDIMGYRIYRRETNREYNYALPVFVPSSVNSYTDSSTATGRKYFYVVAAIDSNYNASKLSNEVSAIPYGINIYVDEDGNSNGNGTSQNPFTTIKKGMDYAISGDTVKVVKGIFAEMISMKNGVSLIGSSPQNALITRYIVMGDSCLLQGFTLSEPNNLGTVFSRNKTITITGNVISSKHVSGSINCDGGKKVKITKNFITGDIHGININYCDSVDIRNNIIISTRSEISLYSDGNNNVINNTLVILDAGLSSTGMFISGGSKTNIFNNIILGNNRVGSTGIFDQGLEHSNLLYNGVWKVTGPNEKERLANEFILVDPMFNDIAKNDFRLQKNSQCKNAGHPNTIYNNMDGSKNDMGAFGGPDPITIAAPVFKITRSISCSTFSSYPGEDAEVYISLDNATELCEAVINLKYDSSIITFKEAMLPALLASSNLKTTVLSKGEIKFTITGISSNQTVDCKILKIVFGINAQSKSGDASYITFSNVRFIDSNKNEVNINSITDGAVAVNKYNKTKKGIYVNILSPGAEDGTVMHPFKSIMKAIEKASAGDSILVSGGDYYESITMKEGVYLIGSGAMVTNIITSGEHNGVVFRNITSAELYGFKIKATNDHHLGSMILCESSSPILKKNCFEASPSNNERITVSSNSNPIFNENYIKSVAMMVTESNPVIDNNMIIGDSFSGIGCSNGSSPLIKNNRISTFIMISNSSGDIINNQITTASYSQDGIILNGASNVIIQNNIITDKTKYGRGINIIGSKDINVYNNTILTHGKGIEEMTSTANIYNNIITGNNEFGVQISPSTILKYNDLWNNSINYKDFSHGMGDISKDPMFIDTSKNNYHLAANSPCKDAGNPSVEFNDRDGSRNDIGAYGGPFADPTLKSQDGSSLSINSYKGISSDTITITINGKNLTGVAELDLLLSYDANLLNLIKANTYGLTQGFTLQKEFIDEDKIHLVLKNVYGIEDNEGVLAKLFFSISTYKSVNTTIQIDSAKVKYESTIENNVIELTDGEISIIYTGINNNDDLKIPSVFDITQNYPNPFNPATTIKYSVPKESHVTISIFNILGQRITELVDEIKKAGNYRTNWNANKYSSGVYFYKITALPLDNSKPYVKTNKMMFLK